MTAVALPRQSVAQRAATIALGALAVVSTAGWLATFAVFRVDLDVAGFALRLLAVAAPVVWFAGVMVLARTGPARSRILLQLAGAVLLFPWTVVAVLLR